MQLVVGIISISIHALHEESDLGVEIELESELSISIHALHEESDRTNTPMIPLLRLFQSTLSMRRATYAARTWNSTARFQSTLSMRRATSGF